MQFSNYSWDIQRIIKTKDPDIMWYQGLVKSVAATYSPTWWGSTIGDGELNFSVRNGKRWILTAITATIYVLRKNNKICNSSSLPDVLLAFGFSPHAWPPVLHMEWHSVIKPPTEEDLGLLVQLGFDITAFTPTAYQRGSLPRPSEDVSSWRWLRA